MFLSLSPNLLAQHDDDGGKGLSKVLAVENSPASTDTLYRGGRGNGFASQIIKTDSSEGIPGGISYRGSMGNGFASQSMKTDFSEGIPAGVLYQGGNGRGETVTLALVDLNPCQSIYKWNGNVSTAWGNPINWDCGVVPNIHGKVLIPTGLFRYPVVSSTTEIFSLLVQPGAIIQVQPNVELKINGH